MEDYNSELAGGSYWGFFRCVFKNLLIFNKMYVFIQVGTNNLKLLEKQK